MDDEENLEELDVTPFGREKFDITPLDTAIETSEAAKKGVVVSEDGTDLPAGTYWVTQEDMDALDAATAEVMDAKKTVETQQDVAEAVEALEAAVSIFNDAKREAIDEEEELEESVQREETEE